MKRNKNRLYMIVVLGVISWSLQAQNPKQHEIDSLTQILQKDIEDSVKLSTLTQLVEVYLQTGDPGKSEEYANTLLSWSQVKSNKQGMAKAFGLLGNIQTNKGDSEKAINCYKESVKNFQEINDINGAALSTSNMGLIYYRQGKNEEAISLQLEALRLYEQISYKRGIGNVHIHLGNLCSRAGQYDEAINHFKQSQQIFEELNYKKGQADALGSLASIYLNHGQFEEALSLLQKGLELKGEIGDAGGMAINHYNISTIYFNQGKFDLAAEHANASLKIRQELSNKRGIAKCHFLLGSILFKTGNPGEALQSLEDALKEFTALGLKPEIAETHYVIGDINMYLSDYPTALKNFQAGITLYEEINDPEGIASVATKMGELYKHMGNYDDALHQLGLALEINEQLQNNNGIAATLHTMAMVYTLKKEHDKAIACLQRSLDLANLMNSQSMIADVNIELADVFHSQKKYQESLLYLKPALAIYNEIGVVDGEITCLINLGISVAEIAHQNLGNTEEFTFESALQSIDDAEKIIQVTGSSSRQKDVYQAYSRIYALKGDYEKAFEFHSKYTTLKDSILNNETTRKLEQLRMQFAVDKAVTLEKSRQDSLLTSQQYEAERKQAAINAQHQLEITEAKAEEEKAVEAAKYRYLLQLSAAKTEQEKKLAEQQYQNELKIADENAKHQIALADERAKQATKDAELEVRLKSEKSQRQRRVAFVLGGIGLIGLLSLFFVLYRRQQNLKQKAIERADTIHKMTELELQSLRAQLNPHFMFNSLNAIQELILLEENDKSHTYLARFAKLLRMLLENANSPFIPLARELEFLQLYLSLENLRIPDLKYDIKVDPGINTEQVKIPNMILQPYIENAIWHGLSPKAGEKKLQIHIAQQNGSTVYEIEDNGIGRQKAAEMKSLYRKEHKSRGMELLTKRFKLLSKEYGSEINTTVSDVMQNHDVQGTKVTIEVPMSLYKEQAVA